MTNRLRTESTDHLLATALESGVRRLVAQSDGGHWTNQRTGGPVKTENDPLVEDPGKEARQTLKAVRHLEEAVTMAAGIEGVVVDPHRRRRCCDRGGGRPGRTRRLQRR